MLTRKQHDLLTFINSRLNESGVSPSFEEMKEALALKSKSGVHRLINALEERAFIRRLPNRARALEILRMPEVVQRNVSLPAGSRRPSGEVVHADFRKPPGRRRTTSSSSRCRAGSRPGSRSCDLRGRPAVVGSRRVARSGRPLCARGVG